MDLCILPILSYGCQCWNFTGKATEKLVVEQKKNGKKNDENQENKPSENTKKFRKLST